MYGPSPLARCESGPQRSVLLGESVREPLTGENPFPRIQRHSTRLRTSWCCAAVLGQQPSSVTRKLGRCHRADESPGARQEIRRPGLLGWPVGRGRADPPIPSRPPFLQSVVGGPGRARFANVAGSLVDSNAQRHPPGRFSIASQVELLPGGSWWKRGSGAAKHDIPAFYGRRQREYLEAQNGVELVSGLNVGRFEPGKVLAQGSKGHTRFLGPATVCWTAGCGRTALGNC